MTNLTPFTKSAAQSGASRLTKFVKFGGVNKSGSSALQGLNAQQNFSSTTSKNLSYPLNVEGDPEQGHYIIFYIMQMDNAKIKKKAAEAAKAVKKAGTAGSFDQAAKIAGNQYKKSINSNSKVAAFQKGAGAGKSLGIARPPIKKLDRAIALYMPPSVKVQYKANYTDETIGALAQAGGDVFNTLAKGGGVKDAASTAFGSIATAGLTKGVDAMSKLAPGAKALAQIVTGKAISDKMELQFNGIERRDFSYTFNFIPKSEEEAKMVEEIVYAFKKHMLPSYTGDIALPKVFGKELSVDFKGKIMNVPDMFDIEYHHQGQSNPFLNRVSSCYLTTVDVAYGGDRYKTYARTSTTPRANYSGGGEGPPPQKTTLTLSFREIEMITRERVEAGY
tara:strand:- start:672 stop:1844 length:1173 start_codon:yes stop_codon:yes gene_type:complete